MFSFSLIYDQVQNTRMYQLLGGGEPKKLDNQEYTANVPFSFILISHVLLFVTPWTVAYQAPLSMGFSRQ